MMTVSAILIGIVTVGANKKAEVDSVVLPSTETAYFFQFTGVNGQEDNPLLWKQITQNQYDEADCEGDYRGCTLISTSVSTTAGQLHPDQVEVSEDPNNPNNQSPITGSGVIEVQNKAMSY